MQNIKRIVKKIGAISAGALFAGATLMGAMAADLSEYPSPFVTGGAYSSAAVITSSNGLDANAGLFIVNGLSGAITTTSSGSSSTTTVAGAYKLQYSGNSFNLGDTAYDIDNKLSKTQLPVLLAKGIFKDDEGTNTGDTEYTQELKFTNNVSASDKSIWYIYDQNSEDSNKPMGDFIYLSKSGTTYAWTYEFNLDSPVTVANSADIQGTKLTMLGKQFTISAASFTTGNVTKLTLLAGDVTQVIGTGETVNGVTLVAVDTNGNSCTIEYGGVTETITDGSTKTMADGTIIGVTDVVPSNKQATPDYCELNIGADKVELEQAKEVKVNGDAVTGTKVTFTGQNGFDVFNVSFKPSDKVFLAPGGDYVDPIFGAFKLMFAGIVEDSPEDVKLDASGEIVTLTATNKDGDTTTWDIAFANTTGVGDIMPGADVDEPFIALEGDFVTNTSMGETELSDMDGIRFLFSMNDRSHIVRIKSIDTLTNKTTFYDETTATEYADQAWTSNVSSSFSFMPSTFQLTFARGDEFPLGTSNSNGVIGNDVVIFDNINDKGPSYSLSNGGNITFWSNWSGPSTGGYGLEGLPGNEPYWLTFQELDSGKESNIALNTINVNMTYSSTNQEINFAAVTSNNDFSHRSTSLKQSDKSETTVKSAKTVYGTFVEQVTPTGSGADSITISTPDTATYAEVYIAPVGSSVTTSTVGASGLAILDDNEVTDVAMYNAIVVGGPAANTIAAELLGLTYPTYGADSGLNEGEAMIKMVNNGAKVAMIVFGWESDDTRRAAKVLESYDAYTLSGEEVSVTGTTSNPTIASA
jgi:hypothetical protein